MVKIDNLEFTRRLLNNQKDQGWPPTYTSQAQISFGRKSAGKLREVSDRRLYLVQPSPKSP
jgi:hypothetical protein